MNLLALELSSSIGSLAIFKDSKLAAASEWKQERRGSRILFEKMPALLEEVGLRWDELDLFAMGRGPGNYSGLRIALSSLQALALPGEKDVYTVSSGAALVHEFGAALHAEKIAVIGDARRERIWLGRFGRSGANWDQEGAWELATVDEVRNCHKAGFQLVSSEVERVGPLLGGVDLAEHFPHANGVGALVLNRIQQGLPSDEVSPLYLHPAVMVRDAANTE